jgi:hypothetical protein
MKCPGGWRGTVLLCPFTKSQEVLVFHFPSAGSDEEYIYMNKVTVTRQQNEDKGMGLERHWTDLFLEGEA